jgi:cysteine-rich repeat protein
MKLNRIALLGLTGLTVGIMVSMGACSSSDQTDPGSTGSGATCGDGQVGPGEECDDGNGDDTDGCDQNCRLPVCGNGVAQQGEECDDGNSVDDDCCSNSCVASTAAECDTSGANCGNGVVDANEDCDESGVDTATCNKDCSMASCGDGYVNAAAGECCEPTEFAACQDCKGPVGVGQCTDNQGGGGMGPDCTAADIFAGVVTNMANPAMAGTGVPSVWSYGGVSGVQAGNDMCGVIGADHVCSYKEIEQAKAKGEFNTTNLPASTYWLHRVTETVMVGGNMSPPGPGGRCNDWTYPTDHISDGEFMTVDAAAAITYSFDQETQYSGDVADMYQGSGANDGGACGGAGNRGILCCYPVCVP